MPDGEEFKMAEPTTPGAITTGGLNYVPQATALHGECFKTDPVINFMLNTLPAEERRAYIPIWIGRLVQAGALNGGVIDEIGDFSCSALWIPPGRSIDNLQTYWAAGLHQVLFKLGVVGVKKMLWDYQGQANSAKKEELYARGWKEFYYLFFISTKEDCRGKGLGAVLVKRFQEKARNEGLPIWLESTTKGSMRLYKRLGFETKREIVLGEGAVAANGDVEQGGSGVRIWAMIWEPHPPRSVGAQES